MRIEQLRTARPATCVRATSRHYTTLFFLSCSSRFFALAIIGRSLPLSGVIYALVLAAPAWCPNCPYATRRRRPQRPIWSGAASLSGPLLRAARTTPYLSSSIFLHLLPLRQPCFSSPFFLHLQLPAAAVSSPPASSDHVRRGLLLHLQLLPSPPPAS